METQQSNLNNTIKVQSAETEDDDSNESNQVTQSLKDEQNQNQYNQRNSTVPYIQQTDIPQHAQQGSLYARNVDYAPSFASTAMSHREQKALEIEIKAEKDAEDEEKAERLKRKKPQLSIPWTIADNRFAMTLIQLIVLCLSVLMLYLAFKQSPWIGSASSSCPATRFGPFIAINDQDKDVKCSWTQANTVLHSIPALFGLISSAYILGVTIVKGPHIARFISEINKDITTEAEDKPEYFDIYSTLDFRILRKVVGWSGYLQFISFGADVICYKIGQYYVDQEDALKSTGNAWFQYLLFTSFPLAVLLRFSHDSMYQREYNFVLHAVAHYQGATIRGGMQNVDSVISGSNALRGPSITQFAGTKIASSPSTGY